MDRITIWLADENEHYVELLKRYIRSSSYSNRLNIAAYTDIECFRQITTQIDCDGIVLVSALFLPLCSEVDHPIVIQLCESRNQEEIDPQVYVYKYRPVNQLIDQLLNIYFERKGNVKPSILNSGAKPRVITVYSASGGSGVTTLSTNLAEFMASMGKKVFYINLESIHSFSSFTKDNQQARFTQVLYMIKSGQPLLGKLHQFIQSDHSCKYDMFHPTRYLREWLEYEREDMQLLLRAIEHTGRYEVIVMDVGNSLYNHVIGALEFSDEILWMMPDRKTALSKAEYIKDELMRISTQLHDQIIDRSKYVLQLNGSDIRINDQHIQHYNEVLPFVEQWHLGNETQPPLSYRQALMRLIGMTTDEELVTDGATNRHSLHRLA